MVAVVLEQQHYQISLGFQESERKVNLLLSMYHTCNCFYLSCYQSSQHNNPQFVWVVPALRQLHEITRSFIKQTYQKQDKVRLYADKIFEAFVVSVLLCQTWKFEFKKKKN